MGDGLYGVAEGHEHGPAELCEAGLDLYGQALREGGIPAGDSDHVPCLLGFGLLHADAKDPRWLRPLAPALALPRLLHESARDIARRRHDEARLAEAFEPLLALDGLPQSVTEVPGIGLLAGFDRINEAIGLAMDEARDELLTIQPEGKRSAALLRDVGLDREQRMLSRGCRIRTLYQDTTRHDLGVIAHFERLTGDVQVRTLDEVTKRLLIVDRSVAFLPASEDRTHALEIRVPALVSFLATVFDRLWRLATPMYPETVRVPSTDGVTPRQRAIAHLLVEGHTDTVIAARLGLNIRTARLHIARLAAKLGSESRAQLGYLIAESGILKQEDTDQ
ncbi:helix-turn-helix transcriptional regulator [Streptomyces europaeiscabiei]|uniref:helix-turn-helix transcriptional regulator n=1 Tax=Streptomyces europaeiscabiei TaxID=146819 RepID=UPI0029A5D110|nr:helix-turn-helix transcriptional regulator [Streptomyces europaeiscabiei]MDX3617800.1 helix-turn-helix transcriptional regulator [Streptomyces europaeiscabiei]MDX3631781.1 helix-turn-helix transcriptional regulator [Streptomyces europaeiscabiei]MDX3649562.1 helix-turn-helix transcriptional regulator [Streptomyces europaeiscabiei]